MKLNLISKIIIALTIIAVAFCAGFFTGYSNGKTTINITTPPPSAHSTDSEISQDNSEILININTAGKEELMLLPGIGTALADAIIDYRETNGYFEKTEDIMNVKGISLSVYRSIKTLITV